MSRISDSSLLSQFMDSDNSVHEHALPRTAVVNFDPSSEQYLKELVNAVELIMLACYEDDRPYIESWEDKFTWPKRASDGTQNGYCKLCHQMIPPKMSNIAYHKSVIAM